MSTLTERPAGQPQRGWVASLAQFNWRSYGMLIALGIIVLLFTWLTDGIFLSPRNVAQLMRQAALLVVVASGVALLIIQREIDLSIGSAVYLAGLAAATAQTQWGWSTAPAILVALAVGMAMGAWQGFWVSRFAIPSFVVTLSGLLAFRGIGYVWSNAATYAPMNRSFGALSESFVPPLASAILVLALLVVFTAGVAWRWRRQRTRFGGGLGAGFPAVEAGRLGDDRCAGAALSGARLSRHSDGGGDLAGRGGMPRVPDARNGRSGARCTPSAATGRRRTCPASTSDGRCS